MYTYIMFGSSKGVEVEYGQLKFVIPAPDAVKMFELVDGLRTFQNIPVERLGMDKMMLVEDDLTEDVYVGPRYFRYAGYRIPIKDRMGEFGTGLDFLHMALSGALDCAERERLTEVDRKSATGRTI